MTQAEALSELHDFEELEKMPSLEHGAIGIRLGRYLDAYVDEPGQW
jgi:Uma2 family endonuclease